MVAAYAAQVAHRGGDDAHHVPSSHSPDLYRHPTSNGNSVSKKTAKVLRN